MLVGMQESFYGKIEILRGDITKLDVDAIVNAANTTLLGGGGVDGAIHRAAGPNCSPNAGRWAVVNPAKRRLLADIVCRRVSSFTLSDRSGAAGNVDEARTLANCYRNSLQLAVENRIKTIGFPAISCGAYGYPIEEAAQIAFKTTREFLAVSDKIQK